MEIELNSDACSPIVKILGIDEICAESSSRLNCSCTNGNCRNLDSCFPCITLR
uniref:Uncharacterized protein n=1 Tax=Rhizophora mucronata TaxID=61149 RepID=A0A2P2PCV7_RHIMU